MAYLYAVSINIKRQAFDYFSQQSCPRNLHAKVACVMERTQPREYVQAATVLPVHDALTSPKVEVIAIRGASYMICRSVGVKP